VKFTTQMGGLRLRVRVDCSPRLSSLYFILLAASGFYLYPMKGKIGDGEARDRLVIWLRRRMEEFGITFEALAESIQHDVDHAPQFRDAKGNEWNGLGDMPDWLRAATHAGVSPDFFRIEPKRELQREVAHHDRRDAVKSVRQLDLF
jgi:DNA-binding protein H-NS